VTRSSPGSHETPHAADDGLSAQVMRSALATDSTDGTVAELKGFHQWFTDYTAADQSTVTEIPFAGLTGWRFEGATGNLVHESGRFFSIRGLRVRSDQGPICSWSQPIIVQPEVGVLGILVKKFNGVLHCLMQAKMEPGNHAGSHNGIQLSPTVQATRSNYTGVHGGKPVPYIEYFRTPLAHHVLADVLHSEQGSWFHRKRNRNMIVEVAEDITPLPGFHWLSIGQLHELLRTDDLVNMDARTVLSCLPFATPGRSGTHAFAGDAFRSALMGRSARTRRRSTLPVTSGAGSPTRGCASRSTPRSSASTTSRAGTGPPTGYRMRPACSSTSWRWTYEPATARSAAGPSR